MRKVQWILVLFATMFVQACDRGGSSGSGGASGTLRIAVIPKGTTHVYWKSVEAGVHKAEKELGVEVIWKGPLKENDRAQQIGIVEQFVGDKVDAIVVAPLDDTALLKPVQEATSAKIPVVIIDSSLKGEVGKDFVSYVATDNHKGGELAGEQLVGLLGGKGKVVLLRYMEASASTNDREAGFLSVMEKNPGITVLVKDRYAGATAAEAQTSSMNILDQIKQADGVFCPNESSTFGMLLALKQSGLAGKVKFVGFDATPQLVDALKEGSIDALIAQDPVKMGYEGVKAAVAAAKGQPVPQHVDTGVHIITKTSLAEPEIQKLLAQ